VPQIFSTPILSSNKLIWFFSPFATILQHKLSRMSPQENFQFIQVENILNTPDPFLPQDTPPDVIVHELETSFFSPKFLLVKDNNKVQIATCRGE
tara:strand:- start:626 stop:910 length:285 start_codon:yes stop_codon:yes gene_type:complete